MPECDRIPISQLVDGWLNLLEVEALNELKESRLFARSAPDQFAANRVKYSEYKLATIRQIRQRIPRAWNKASVTQE